MDVMSESQLEQFQEELMERLSVKYAGVELTDEVLDKIARQALNVMQDNNYPQGREYEFTFEVQSEEDPDFSVSMTFFLATPEEIEQMEAGKPENEDVLCERFGPHYRVNRMSEC